MLIFLGFSAFSQPGWNWPEDPAEDRLAKEKQAYYKVQMGLDSYEGAFESLTYLYNNVPDLNESIYIDGAKVIDEILDTGVDAERKQQLEDSLLWTFDMRVKYFDNDASTIDRKAYTAFKMYYKNPAKYALLKELYEELYKQNPTDISDFNLTPYITLAAYYYKNDPIALPAEGVLDIHQAITTVIDEKISNGGDREKLQKEQDKIDAFLNSLGNILSCDFIEKNLVPKFNQDPSNLNMAKKIFSYSLKAKCTDEEYFSNAGETLFQNEPSFQLAKALGDKAYSQGNYEKALEYYARARETDSTPDQKFEAFISSASTYSKMDKKIKARSMAYEALSIKPGAKEAFNLIGNLYFTSYETCKGGESKVKDRAVFLAAYEMYQKAGNASQMAASKEQFPSIEDIFNENYEEGQKITINCWINESVAIQRR